MKLRDLKTGHVVLFREGKYGIVMLSTDNGDRIVKEDHSYISMTDFNEEMKCPTFNNFDIVAVHEQRNIIDALYIFNNKKWINLNTPAYVEKLDNILNERIDNLQKQLDELRKEVNKKC